VSITWQMVDVPHGAVQSRILEQLLEADEHLARKRVTIIYRPHDPASAARVADADVRTASAGPPARGEVRAGESLALASARQSPPSQGRRRRSDPVLAAGHRHRRRPRQARPGGRGHRPARPACQLRLRRCYFGQAAAHRGPGRRRVLPKHVAVPQVVRDYL
jgi:hypothetical protein